MHKRQAVETSNAPSAIGPYSQAIIIDRTIYISGQLGLKPDGIMNGRTTREQAAQALKNVLAIAEAAGADRHHIVKLTVFMTDLQEFGAVNNVLENSFTEPYPARACVQVASLPKQALIEIEAIAVYDKSSPSTV